LRTARVLRALTVIVLLAVLVLLYRTLRPGPRSRMVTAGPRAMLVRDALGLARPDHTVVVSGYAFRNGNDIELCSGRTTARRPSCIGPFLYLDGLDPARLDLRRGYTLDPVTVSGTVTGSSIQVSQLLQ
jgi:hypothetical protein